MVDITASITFLPPSLQVTTIKFYQQISPAHQRDADTTSCSKTRPHTCGTCHGASAPTQANISQLFVIPGMCVKIPLGLKTGLAQFAAPCARNDVPSTTISNDLAHHNTVPVLALTCFCLVMGSVGLVMLAQSIKGWSGKGRRGCSRTQRP